MAAEGTEQDDRVWDRQGIPSTALWAFIHNGPYFLTEITVYQDGLIDCWELVDIEGFERKIVEGWVVTAVPEGAHVDIGQLAHLTATDVQGWVLEREFVKEVRDAIERLNGRPTSDDRCQDAYRRFMETPTGETRAVLAAAYEAVPAHLRQYLLHDMDVKDIPIRMIIYGDKEIEQWSHRALARAQGHDPLPDIVVPQVTDPQEPS